MVARASAEAGRALTPQEASAYWTRRALEFIRTHPAEAARITLRKAALMLNGTEVPNHLDYTFIREHAPALWLMPVGFGGVLALAVIGIGAGLRRRQRRAEILLLVLVAAGAFASILPFTVADRYRAPMVPALLVAAGAGLVTLVRLVRDARARADRGMLVVLAASLLAAAVTMIPLVRPLRGRDYWMFAQAYQAHGDLPAAIAAYEAAVREEDGNGELLNNLAMAYRAAGDRARAEATLRRAIAAAPALAYPHKNLGMLLVVRGENDSALVQLREAERLEPDDAEAAGAVGALLAERGERAGAAAAFARARALAPHDRRLRALIDHYSAPKRRSR
jgi:tetratricopeptide (TPR) repeat protein